MSLDANSAVTDEEVQIVAEELAKVGGVSWYPGREPGPLMRAVTDRYRAQARVVIAALERIRTGSEPTCSQDLGGDGPQKIISGVSSGQVRPGATVIYCPIGDRRASPCRIVEIQGDRAYLAPILRTCVGWVSLEWLQPSADERVPSLKEPAAAVVSALSSATSRDGENG